MTEDPHADGRLAGAGPPLDRARLAVVAAHGRGGSAEDILALTPLVAHPDLAWLAPEAAGRSWWPESFLAPLVENEPALGSALAALGRAVDAAAAQLADDRIVLLGFSQGACLALEYAARAGRRLRAVAGLSGGLIGTSEAGGGPREALYGRAPKRFDYDARLDGLPVMLRCHERDPHIPLARVRETAAVFERLGAPVDARVHPGAGHAIMEDDLRALRGLLA